MPATHALDISHYQTITSWDAVKGAGVVGVLHKCTEGTTYLDSTYSTRQRAAAAAGLKWGAYHFLKHGSIPQQMDWFVKNAYLPRGSRIAIDYEDPHCTLDDLEQAIEQIETIDETLQIAVYSGHLIKEQVGSKNVPWLEKTSLWIAHYTTAKQPTWPKQIWPKWSLWQFSDKGHIAGITGDVDLDNFNGSPEQCAAWFGPADQPGLSPSPELQVVEITIAAPPGVQIKVNGKLLEGE